MNVADLRQRLRGLGAGALHEQQLLRLWALALPLDGGKRRPENFLPQRLRQALPELAAELDALVRLQSAHPALARLSHFSVDNL